MMLPLLCIFNEGKELSLSKCALTTAFGWPNLLLSVLSASLYITPQYANSAMVVLVFPVTRNFKYFNLTLAVKECASMALLNCPNHSCHYRGSPLYCDNFHSGSGSFFLQVIASANCFFKSAESKEGAEAVGCGGPPQHKGVRNGSSIRWRNDRIDKGGGGTCGRTKWTRFCMKSNVK